MSLPLAQTYTIAQGEGERVPADDPMPCTVKGAEDFETFTHRVKKNGVEGYRVSERLTGRAFSLWVCSSRAIAIAEAEQAMSYPANREKLAKLVAAAKEGGA